PCLLFPPSPPLLSPPPYTTLFRSNGLLFGDELAANVNVERDGVTYPVETMARIDVAPAVEIASITPSPLVLTPVMNNKPTAFTLDRKSTRLNSSHRTTSYAVACFQ